MTRTEINVASESAWTALQEEIRTRGAALLEWPGVPPVALHMVQVAFQGPAGALAEGVAQVVHVAPDGHVAVVFGAGKEAILGAMWPAEPVPEEGGDAVAPDDDPEGGPLWSRYDALPMSEKIKLARHGNADARRQILRDRNPVLHLHVLDNPGVTAVELATILKGQQLNQTFVQRVMQRTDWMASAAVLEALVQNPKTPVPIAVKLVDKLPIELVRRIARQGNLKMPILQAARRRVIVK